MVEVVNRDWIVTAAFRLKAAADDLWQRMQRFYAELMHLEGVTLSEEPAFDREYFRQRMAEARERRRDERLRRVAEMLASQSGPVTLDEPVRLEAIPGLSEALDGLVGLPIPVELLRRFAGRSDFDLEAYQRHILAHAGLLATAFEAIPALIDDDRKDRIFRFIAVIFLAHGGRLEIWQEADRILVKKRETHEQGQGVFGPVAEAA